MPDVAVRSAFDDGLCGGDADVVGEALAEHPEALARQQPAGDDARDAHEIDRNTEGCDREGPQRAGDEEREEMPAPLATVTRRIEPLSAAGIAAPRSRRMKGSSAENAHATAIQNG